MKETVIVVDKLMRFKRFLASRVLCSSSLVGR